jgi:hypothetical protein
VINNRVLTVEEGLSHVDGRIATLTNSQPLISDALTELLAITDYLRAVCVAQEQDIQTLIHRVTRLENPNP